MSASVKRSIVPAGCAAVIAVAAGTTWLMFGTEDGAGRRRAPNANPMRTLSVAVVVDEEFRQRPRWRDDARAVLRNASDLAENTLAVEFRLSGLWEWNSRATAETLEVLRIEAKRALPSLPTDLVLVLCDQGRAIHHPPDSKYWGGASFHFDPWVIVRPKPLGGDWPYESEIVVHEIGHAFGLWHCSDQSTLMRRCDTYKGPAATMLDEVSRQVVQVTRGLDLRLGVEGISSRVEDDLTRIYLNSGAMEEDHPIVRSCLLHALQSRNEGVEEAEWRPMFHRAERLIKAGSNPRTLEARNAARQLR